MGNELPILRNLGFATYDLLFTIAWLWSSAYGRNDALSPAPPSPLGWNCGRLFRVGCLRRGIRAGGKSAMFSLVDAAAFSLCAWAASASGASSVRLGERGACGFCAPGAPVVT